MSQAYSLDHRQKKSIVRECVRATVFGGTDSAFRAMSLLRRKSFEVVQMELVKASTGDEVYNLMMVVEKRESLNPHSPKLLIEKLVGFSDVTLSTSR